MGHKKEKYKKRHIIENCFSWLDIKIPRLARIYDKKNKKLRKYGICGNN